MSHIALSRRALLDIRGIEIYSTKKWGDKAAAEYLQGIEDALNLLRENSSLLKAKPNISNSLCFYRVRQHLLVCASFKDSIFVLTVKHGAMDLPSRIAELEPQLLQEAEMLYQAYQQKKRQS